jgi:hypothetical protein
MADKISPTTPKRLSKSQRTHVRRLKQEAGKNGAAAAQPTGALPPSRPPKQEN